MQDLYEYFPDYSEHDIPERDYLWTIISSIMPQETKSLIQEARAARGVQKKEEQELVRITPQLKEEIFNIVAQKSKQVFLIVVLATKGNATFMLKQSAVLKKRRKQAKTYQADYESLKKHGRAANNESYDARDVSQAMKAQLTRSDEKSKY